MTPEEREGLALICQIGFWISFFMLIFSALKALGEPDREDKGDE